MNNLIKSLITNIKNDFEKNNIDLKKQDPQLYKEKLEKHIFRIYMFVAVIIMSFGVFVTFFITEILF